MHLFKSLDLIDFNLSYIYTSLKQSFFQDLWDSMAQKGFHIVCWQYHLEPLNFCGYELVKASLINDYQNLFCWLINPHQLKPVGRS